jgi:hypothetical protein
MPHDVVNPAALLRSFFPRRPLDDVFGNWAIEAIEDLYYRSTAHVTHNVTGEKFQVPDEELGEHSGDLGQHLR